MRNTRLTTPLAQTALTVLTIMAIALAAIAAATRMQPAYTITAPTTVTVTHYPPCVAEDDVACYWHAPTRYNGTGTSTLRLANGTDLPLDHATAEAIHECTRAGYVCHIDHTPHGWDIITEP